MTFVIRRSRTGYDVSLQERTGYRRVYNVACKESHTSMNDALEMCRVYGRGLTAQGHDVKEQLQQNA